MAWLKFALKSPLVPLFQRWNFLCRTLTPLWKRGEGEIFGGTVRDNYVANFWRRTLPLVVAFAFFPLSPGEHNPTRRQSFTSPRKALPPCRYFSVRIKVSLRARASMRILC